MLKTPGIADGAWAVHCIRHGAAHQALDATFFNGTASHALDFDDFSGIMGGHQSVPWSRPLRCRGARRLRRRTNPSYVLGVETEIRLARAVNFHHYDKGWHPTATLGIFGAAAAVGTLIGSTRNDAMALAIAASFASGVKANFGTMAKPLHVGQSARNGLLAAFSPNAASTPTRPCSSTSRASSNAFNGPGNYDVEARSSTTGPTR